MIAGAEMFGGLLPIVEPFGATSLFLALTANRPMAAGPGAMAMVLAIQARVDETTTSTAWSTAGLVVGIALVSTTVYGGLWLASRLGRFLSRAAVDALGRVFGLIVLSIGVEMVVRALATHAAFQ